MKIKLICINDIFRGNLGSCSSMTCFGISEEKMVADIFFNIANKERFQHSIYAIHEISDANMVRYLKRWYIDKERNEITQDYTNLIGSKKANRKMFGTSIWFVRRIKAALEKECIEVEMIMLENYLGKPNLNQQYEVGHIQIN